MAAYTYLPWVREGLIGAVEAGTVSGGRLALPVQVSVCGGAGGTSPPVNVLLFGPGDVTGFDPRQVIRTDPRPLSSDFEPNYFPLVEFDRPDFPWLVTPAAPDAKNQLPPWICLIVVERRDGVELTSDGSRPLPVLSIASDAHRELPDLSEAWAWAHAQVGAVTSDADLATALKSQPLRTLSRLMCPRRLKGKTPYVACVVPTYKGGVQAGLGEPVDGAHALDAAWTLAANPPANIRLPVYYSWDFSTGAQGDFESLVWELQRRRLTLDDVGTRKLEIGDAGYGLPPGASVDLEGALAPSPSQDDPARVGASTAYQQRLQALLNESTSIPPLPVLPPPIYGRWHALERTIPDPIAPGRTRDRAWLRTLNLDPRYRVAAGLGAQVVREQQEQLMASAWDQVGDVMRANQMLRQSQLARAASLRVHEERFGKLDAATFLLMTAPVQPRVRYLAAQSGTERTARGHVTNSALPVAATSVQFRRAVRPRGAVARRFGIATRADLPAIFSRLNVGEISAAPVIWPVPKGLATMEGVLDRNPCRTDPAMLARALLEKRQPSLFICALDDLLKVFANRQTDIAALGTLVRDQLERVAKLASVARDLLNAFERRRSRPDASFLELVLTLYKPALGQIADLRWLLQRAVRGFGPAPPQVIEELINAAAALPSLDELRDINVDLAIMVHLQNVEPCEPIVQPPKPPLDIAELKTRVHARLNPATTIAARIATLIEAPGWDADDLDEILAAPEFPMPMYKALASVAQDWLLPGLDRVPPNTLALLDTNPQFIEAFMVGLNHEMSRELLWRGYPTDQRGTYFRQFWDPSGRFAPTQDGAVRARNAELAKDIPPLHQWGEGPLGAHFGTVSGGQAPAAAPTSRIVLLIRGELLRRYERAEIFLAKAAWSLDQNNVKGLPRNPTSEEKHPIFRGALTPDIQLLGFDITPSDAQGTDEPANDPNDDGAGWFVVIRQQPTESRYGLDETVATSPVAQWTWRDLSWVHTNLTEDGGYVRLAGGLKAEFPASAQRGTHGEEWRWTSIGGKYPDSAQIACITLQRPVRVAIHASDLI